MKQIITMGLSKFPNGARFRCIAGSSRSGTSTSKAAILHSCSNFSLETIRKSRASNCSIATIYQSGRSLPRLDIQRRWYIKPELAYSFNHTIHDDHPLSEHITTCHSSQPRGKSVVADTEFSILFLGSGGGIPKKNRICSSTLLRVGHQSFLFDAPEGLQRQAMFARLSLKSITKIFITHMHADHVLGLPGMLLFMNQISHNRANIIQGNAEPMHVDIYGPPGLYDFVVMNMELTRTGKIVSSFVVHELMGSDADSRPSERNSSRVRRHNVTRKTIPRNDDGTWTICTPSVTKKPKHVGQDETLICAAEIQHAWKIPTFGFTVKEREPGRNIDVERAKACGIAPSQKYKSIKAGISVISDDGSRMVHPNEVLSDQANRKARTFAYLGDTWKPSPAMYKLCQDCDILVHEATVVDGSNKEARVRGHSTPGMAGQVAQQVNATVLVLNHISPKNKGEEDEAAILAAAVKANEGASSVLVAHDFMEIVVPWAGFDFSQSNMTEESEESLLTTLWKSLSRGLRLISGRAT